MDRRLPVFQKMTRPGADEEWPFPTTFVTARQWAEWVERKNRVESKEESSRMDLDEDEKETDEEGGFTEEELNTFVSMLEDFTFS